MLPRQGLRITRSFNLGLMEDILHSDQRVEYDSITLPVEQVKLPAWI